MVFSASAWAATTKHIHTDIYPLDGKAILFKMERTLTTDGSKQTLENVFTDTDGKVVVTENAELENGKIVHFKQDQKQINAQGEVTVENGKAKFTYTKNGKTKNDEEKVGDDFIVTASLYPYLETKWDELKKGKKIRAHLGVLDRLEVIEFQFKKQKEIKLDDGKPGLIIKMTPSSFVIAALVDPIYFKVSEDGATIVDIKGRTPLKIKDGSDWDDFDGLSVYKNESAKN
jgi:hypothetical protein